MTFDQGCDWSGSDWNGENPLICVSFTGTTGGRGGIEKIKGAPTRELANQVHSEVQLYLVKISLRFASTVGRLMSLKSRPLLEDWMC